MLITKLRLTLFITVSLLLIAKPSTSFKPVVEIIKNNEDLPLVDEDEALSLFNKIEHTGIKFSIFQLAYKGYINLKKKGKLSNDRYLSIADFTKPSNLERLYIIDIKEKKLCYKTLVAHGMNTGNLYAKDFSNKIHSNQSSIGFFTTNEIYTGKQGLSLRLDGQDGKFNSAARIRGVVIHGADYVSHNFAKRTGRLGRSFGCPALPRELNKDIIETIKGKSCFFIYYPDTEYLHSSTLINNKSNLLATRTHTQAKL